MATGVCISCGAEDIDVNENGDCDGCSAIFSGTEKSEETPKSSDDTEEEY